LGTECEILHVGLAQDVILILSTGANMTNNSITLTAALKPGFESILTPDALAFLSELHRRFDGKRQKHLAAREALQTKLDSGEAHLDFLAETDSIRGGAWQIGPVPADLQDRRVEITGPVDRKMVINALNCGAKCYMACFEDASTPMWDIMIEGQINLRDANAKTITLEDKGKSYKLNDQTATLIARPRGWHLLEKHILVDGAPMAGALVDFGLYFFHNAKQLIANGSGPYFYLPKMEHWKEAKLWNDVFIYAQSYLGLPVGTIKATVLIETLPAAFQTEEILWALREHIVALNCGRWDYIFSYIKRQRKDPAKILPDRASVTMTAPFMRKYSLHVIKTCHQHGAHAMGGMSAFIPVKNDEAKNAAAFEQVRTDKTREATDGHDGTWVAHPGLVPVALAVFNALMPTPSQRHKIPDIQVTAADLTTAIAGPKTLAGVSMNINVGIGYIASWLRGQGAAPLHNLMEDAATAEISRTQLWQWLNHHVVLDSGETVTAALIDTVIAAQLEVWKADVGDNFFATGKFAEAADLFGEMILAKDCPEFLTLPAYDRFLAG
jgi:malate synthase